MMQRQRFYRRVMTPAMYLSAALLAAAGCKHAPDDAALNQAVNSQLAQDGSISGQPLQATVQDGVATLNGSVQNDAQKTIAARDTAGVQGIKEVHNNIAVGTLPPVSAQMTAASPAPVPTAPATKTKGQLSAREDRHDDRREDRDDRHYPAPIERQDGPGPALQADNSMQPAIVQPAPVNTPPPPVAPPPPALRNVTIATGTTIPVRVTQTLDSATTQQGTSFSGVVASDILIDGVVAIPAGTPVAGNVDAVQEAAHYKGSALLTVSLSSISRKGEHLAITTDPYTVQGKGRGGNTAEKVGGGAAVGAILGGIFGGGKGAAIGAAAGGGVGAGANTVTRGQQVQIPSETVVRFHLASPVLVRVRGDGEKNSGDNSLQQHPIQ